MYDVIHAAVVAAPAGCWVATGALVWYSVAAFVVRWIDFDDGEIAVVAWAFSPVLAVCVGPIAVVLTFREGLARVLAPNARC